MRRATPPVDWDAVLGLAVTVPAGTTFWRGIGHSPASLGEGDTLRALSWLSTVRSEASVYARRPATGKEGPWMCEYANPRPLRAVRYVRGEPGREIPGSLRDLGVNDPDLLAGLAARGIDLMVYGERDREATKLGYWDHVRPLATGLLELVRAHETSPEIEHAHFIEALMVVDPEAAAEREGGHRPGP